MSPHAGSASAWQGRTLLDRGGERIGTIEDVFLVEETGRPEWALVRLGRLGRRTTLAPLAGAIPSAKGSEPRARGPRSPTLRGSTATRTPQTSRWPPSTGTTASSPAALRRTARAAATGRRPIAQTRGRPGPSRGAAAGIRDRRSPRGSTLKRTISEFSDDQLTHWAAALTYYAVLSIFPRCWRSSRSSGSSAAPRSSR